jgi:hypothetical protein
MQPRAVEFDKDMVDNIPASDMILRPIVSVSVGNLELLGLLPDPQVTLMLTEF